MVSKSRLALVSLTSVLLAGCASTTIFPGPNNSFSLVTTSSEQSYAEKDAKTKAEDYCLARGKSLVVLDHQTKYNGADKSSVALIGLASAVLTDGPNPAQSSNDYEVRVKFICK